MFRSGILGQHAVTQGGRIRAGGSAIIAMVPSYELGAECNTSFVLLEGLFTPETALPAY
tara:strand:- start:459 stop:635 length:177 start_codon:yes stop_codon:yes gene_type:complete